jgi:glycosyltransferase involved in cell wall biosynthesis
MLRPTSEASAAAQLTSQTAVETSKSSPPKTRMRVLLMDLWCCVPYYMSYLAKGLEAHNVSAALTSVNYYLDEGYFRRQGLRPAPGLLDIVSRLRIRQPMLRRLLRLGEFGINLLALAIRISRSNPDIIHVQYLAVLEKGLPVELWFLRYAARLGIGLVYTAHNVLPHQATQRHREAYDRVYKKMDTLICHDQEAKIRLSREFSIDPDRIWIIPHGPLFCDVPMPSRKDARARMGLLEEERVVLCQGILKPYKGIEFLLDAWPVVQAGNSNARLMIAGIGEEGYIAAIKEKVRCLGIEKSVRLDFRFVPSEELGFIYQSSDVLVYPYKEITTSGALLTGLVYGKPIVATRLPAFRESLRDGEEAVLVNYGDVEGLAAALTRLIQDRTHYERLRRGAASAFEKQSNWMNIGKETRHCYEAALQSAIRRTANPEGITASA